VSKFIITRSSGVARGPSAERKELLLILTHPSRLANARLQGGLNNFAPSALDCESLRRFVGEPSTRGEPPNSTPGGFRRVSFFFVAQGRRETKARQGFRAAGLHHKAQEDEAWGQSSLSRLPTGPRKRDWSFTTAPGSPSDP
jgi:hypothetical protein